MMDNRDDLRVSTDEEEVPADDDDLALGDGMYEPLYPYRLEDAEDSDNELHTISGRKAGVRRKPKYAVKQDFKITAPNPVEMTKLVIEYLVIEGFPEAAKALAAEAHVNFDDVDWTGVEQRVAIKNAILAGNIAEAIEKVKLLCPGLIEGNTSIRFDLYQQRFLEFVKDEDIFGALEWSQANLSSDDLDDDQMRRLEEACTLAAFNDPRDCHYSLLLDQGHRDQIAESVNSAILKAQGKPTTSRVETMFKMKMFMSMNLPMPSDRGEAAEVRHAEIIHADILNEGSDRD